MRWTLLVLLWGAPLIACLWDYDTLAQESAGLPDVKAAIAGGFPRNPPLYYEMRLERWTEGGIIPTDLEKYDAVAVACDRLGRYDEAIEWMARKREAMEEMGYDPSQHEQPNHRYRYLANLGTFHAHRWFAQGADRSDLTDMRIGRDLIAAAIEENPDAHFGREVYQLMAMDWVLNPPEASEVEAYAFSHTIMGRSNVFRFEETFSREQLQEALDGFVGLITMGAAWESVDVINTIRAILAAMNMASFSYFAELRVRELVANNHRSIVWPASLDAEMAFRDLKTAALTTESQTRNEFEELRAAADAWHEARTEYLLAGLKDGRHPDTHENFWAAFDGNPDQMRIPAQRLQVMSDYLFGWTRWPETPYLIPFGAVLISGIGVVLLLRRRRIAAEKLGST